MKVKKKEKKKKRKEKKKKRKKKKQRTEGVRKVSRILSPRGRVKCMRALCTTGYISLTAALPPVLSTHSRVDVK